MKTWSFSIHAFLAIWPALILGALAASSQSARGLFISRFLNPERLSYRLWLTLADKHIPGTPYGFDIVRCPGIVFQFLPQTAHGDIHGTIERF